MFMPFWPALQGLTNYVRSSRTLGADVSAGRDGGLLGQKNIQTSYLILPPTTGPYVTDTDHGNISVGLYSQISQDVG